MPHFTDYLDIFHIHKDDNDVISLRVHLNGWRQSIFPSASVVTPTTPSLPSTAEHPVGTGPYYDRQDKPQDKRSQRQHRQGVALRPHRPSCKVPNET